MYSMHDSRKLCCLCLLFVLSSTAVLTFPHHNQRRLQTTPVRIQDSKTRTMDTISSQSLVGDTVPPNDMTVYYVQRDGRVMVETPQTGVANSPRYRPISMAAFQRIMTNSGRGGPNKDIVYSNYPNSQHLGIPRTRAFKLEVDEPYKHAGLLQKRPTSGSGICIDQRLERIRAKTGAHFPVESGTIVMELDMRLTKEQYRYYYENRRFQSMRPNVGRRRRFKRKTLKSEFTVWPEGVIPYFVQDNTLNSRDNDLLKESMQDWMDNTCIKFRPAQRADSDVLRIEDGNGCTSFVGRIGGQQHLKLHYDCRVKHIMTHELGHVIGLIHEHQRPDRNNYITVASQNVGKGRMRNYQLFEAEKIETYGVEYDYTSIMHYGKTAFSKDGVSTTMITKDPNFQDVIGTGSRVTFKDAKAVNAMYKCSARCLRPPACGAGFVNKNCQCVCPDGTKSCDIRARENNNRRRPTMRRRPRPWTRDFIDWVIPQSRRRHVTTWPGMIPPHRRRFHFSHAWHPVLHPGRGWVARTEPWSPTRPGTSCSKTTQRRMVARREPIMRHPETFMDPTILH